MNACEAITAISEMTAVCAMAPTTKAAIAGAEPATDTPRPSTTTITATAANHGNKATTKTAKSRNACPFVSANACAAVAPGRLHRNGGKQHAQPQRHRDHDNQHDEKNNRGPHSG